jgi:hypothetical protein
MNTKKRPLAFVSFVMRLSMAIIVGHVMGQCILTWL